MFKRYSIAAGYGGMGKLTEWLCHNAIMPKCRVFEHDWSQVWYLTMSVHGPSKSRCHSKKRSLDYGRLGGWTWMAGFENERMVMARWRDGDGGRSLLWLELGRLCWHCHVRFYDPPLNAESALRSPHMHDHARG